MFEAFISYHAKDRSIADYLQAAIREAGKSRGRRTLRLFWDEQASRGSGFLAWPWPSSCTVQIFYSPGLTGSSRIIMGERA